MFIMSVCSVAIKADKKEECFLQKNLDIEYLQ